MKKYIVMLIVFSIVTATDCRANDIDDVFITNREFQMKENFNLSNGVKFTIHSLNPINVSALVSGILDSSDTYTELIKSTIDENRQKYFADEEIILTLTNTNTQLENSASGIFLAKQIVAWNYSTPYGTYWYATYQCHAADMFTYVLYGSYYIYYYNVSKYGWDYLSTAMSAYAVTHAGGLSIKGFAGEPTSSSNKAHIIINFYSAY